MISSALMDGCTVQQDIIFCCCFFYIWYNGRHGKTVKILRERLDSSSSNTRVDTERVYLSSELNLL